jgi:hypothetical protein
MGSSFPGVKRLGREVDYSFPSYTEVKNAWNFTSTPLYAFMACTGTNLYIYIYIEREREREREDTRATDISLKVLRSGLKCKIEFLTKSEGY